MEQVRSSKGQKKPTEILSSQTKCQLKQFKDPKKITFLGKKNETGTS